ncbi:hypothetical protein BH24CHL1_BH24CHL1_17820 [soil metagenome]
MTSTPKTPYPCALSGPEGRLICIEDIDTTWKGTLVPKRTYQPKRIPRKREHGFMKRMRTRAGRAVLARRRLKGRHSLSISTENKPTNKK